MIPEAPTRAIWKRAWLPRWGPGRYFWRLIARCPYCRREHRHGGGIDPAGPFYGSRTSDCWPGGLYLLVPAE
jgi:hypothetical protein